jgi:hypothetical protein
VKTAPLKSAGAKDRVYVSYSAVFLFYISSLFIRKPVADATAAKWNVAIEDSKEVVMVSKTGH